MASSKHSTDSPVYELCSHPSKEQVRQWMFERGQAKSPVPSPAEIRRQLGWKLISGVSSGRR